MRHARHRLLRHRLLRHASLVLAASVTAGAAGCCGCGEPIPLEDVAPVTSWDVVSGPAPEGPARRIRVVSYNVKLLPVIDADGEDARAAAIPGALEPLPDVVVLNEAYDEGATDALLRGLAERGLVHTTEPLTGGWGLFEGGIRIASRWPIERQAGFVFPCGALPDAFADKGVVYAGIRKGADRFHLFGTHLQSCVTSLSPEHAARVQRDQLRLMREFVAEQAIPADEPVLLAGDLNVELDAAAALGGLLELLGADLPPIDRSPTAFTYDGTQNALSRAGVTRWVDYVLLARGHLAPVWAALRALPLRAVGLGDLSDHYAVEGTFVFPLPTEEEPVAGRP